MALKEDRTILEYDISMFCNDTSCAINANIVERGGLTSLTGANASGVSMDDAAATVSYVANISGVKPYGILLQDVVNYDLTKQRQNPWRDEVQTGMKVAVANKCVVVTNWIAPGITPVPGTVAYVAPSGYLSNVFSTAADQSDMTGYGHTVGRFVTGKDQDGFAKVRISLP